MAIKFCVVEGSTPSRENGSSVGRVHIQEGRPVTSCGSTPHKSNAFIPVSSPSAELAASCAASPAVQATLPDSLLPESRGYRLQKEETTSLQKDCLPFGSISECFAACRCSNSAAIWLQICTFFRMPAEPAFRVRLLKPE